MCVNANFVLLQKKYCRIIKKFAEQTGLTLDDALDFFYHSSLYQLLRGDFRHALYDRCLSGGGFKGRIPYSWQNILMIDAIEKTAGEESFAFLEEYRGKERVLLKFANIKNASQRISVKEDKCVFQIGIGIEER